MRHCWAGCCWLRVPQGNLTSDAHLAALALEHGATIGTFDRDFRRFAGLDMKLLGG